MIQIETGDFRTLSEQLADESVDLIFTDPSYDDMSCYSDLVRLAARVLRPNGSLLTFYGIGYLPETVEALKHSVLKYRWQGLWYQINNCLQHGGFGFVVYSPFLWYEKGRAKIYQRTNDVANVPIRNGTDNKYHKWSKQPAVIERYIEALTKPGDLVLDPFLGSGTTALACFQSGRDCIGYEINPVMADVARRRLASAQLPLPLPSMTAVQPILSGCECQVNLA